MVIGLVGNAASVTAAKLFDGDAFHVILYVVGELVLALYANDVVCALPLKHTLVALDARVIVGNTFTEVEALAADRPLQPPLV